MANKALANALKVLTCFDARRPEWRVTDLSRETGLNKSHVVKILDEFIEARVLAQDPVSRRYRVGPRALSIGAGYLTSFPLGRPALPVMRRLAGRTGFTITLNALDGEAVLFCQSVEGPDAVAGNWPVGGHIPWHATAAGKIHAAFLPPAVLQAANEQRALPAITPTTICDPGEFRRQLTTIRCSGIAATTGESTPGLGAFAMPVFGRSERFLGALSLLFPIDTVPADRRRALITELADASARLSDRMGAEHYPFRPELR